MKPSRHLLISIGLMSLLPVTALANIKIYDLERSVEHFATGSDPQQTTFDSSSNQSDAAWTIALQGHEGTISSFASTNCQQDSNIILIPQGSAAISGTGTASTMVKQWTPSIATSGYANSKMSFKISSQQSFTWSLDYQLQASCQHQNYGLAISGIRIVDLTHNLVVRQYGQQLETGHGPQSMALSATDSGSLPAGNYQIIVACYADNNLNDPHGTTYGMGHTSAEWQIDLNIGSVDETRWKDYIERIPPFDPGIVFQEVLVHYGHERFPPEADPNQDNTVDVEDVLLALTTLMESDGRRTEFQVDDTQARFR